VKQTTASIVISALNEADRLPACLESLFAQRTKTPFDIHIVDNGSQDGTYELAKSWAKKSSKTRPLFVWRQPKAGSPAARNLGAHKAKGQLLLFTDADCVFSPQWVEEITKPFRRQLPFPLGAVAGRTNSGFQSSKGPNWIEQYAHERFSFWEEDRLARFPAFLPWAPTCNLAVPKALFKALGGFEEQWTSAAYDVDFCWRLSLSGFVLSYAPKADLTHFRRSTLNGLIKQMRRYSRQNSALQKEYQQALALPRWRTLRERVSAKGRQSSKRLLKLYRPKQWVHWALDQVTEGAMALGKVESLRIPFHQSKQFRNQRKGAASGPRFPALPTAYKKLRESGWVYWCFPSGWEEDHSLVLYHPSRGERFELNSSAHTVLRMKAEGKQSEDAAKALGQDPSDTQILSDIDHLTLDLRTQRLLF
jgi:glycosyltransferase involved in cell wall biosynthesis